MESEFWDYYPDAVAPEDSARYYEVFRGLVRKEKAKVMVYGKTHDEPRYTEFFSRDDHAYKYSGKLNPSAGWPKEIEELVEIAKKWIPGEDVKFNSALVNYYPDGEHRIGQHSDKEATKGHIASFSFGVSRKFHIRKKNESKIHTTFLLGDGSLFCMHSGMQQRYTHELPRMAHVTMGRINVTLRDQ